MRLAQHVLVTEEGWRRLQVEMALLQVKLGAKMDEYLALAKGVERAEATFDHLCGEIAVLDRRIAEIREALHTALPVGEGDREPGTVGVGSRVVVRWEADDSEETYTIVGPPEVDVQASRFSYESPIGRALLGRREGDWVEAVTPDGPQRIELLALA